MNFDYYMLEQAKNIKPLLMVNVFNEWSNFLGDSMTYYVEFEDGTEFVVCCDDEQEARENTTDMQKMAGKSMVITSCKEVAER